MPPGCMPLLPKRCGNTKPRRYKFPSVRSSQPVIHAGVPLGMHTSAPNTWHTLLFFELARSDLFPRTTSASALCACTLRSFGRGPVLALAMLKRSKADPVVKASAGCVCTPSVVQLFLNLCVFRRCTHRTSSISFGLTGARSPNETPPARGRKVYWLKPIEGISIKDRVVRPDV